MWQQVLKSIESSLHDAVWNDLEHPYYHQCSGRVLATLLSLLTFPSHQQYHQTHSDSLPTPAHKAVSVVRKLCALSMPDSLLELLLELAEGKVKDCFS